MQIALWFALGLLSLSQVAILDWGVRLGSAAPAAGAGGLGGLGPFAWAGATLAIGAANFAIFPMARRRLRADGWHLAFGRGWILFSIGALSSGLLLLVVNAVVRGGHGLVPDASSVARGALLVAGGAAVAIGFGWVAWAYLLGQRGVQVERVTLPLPGVSTRLEELRIAHLTDLHIGPLLRAPQLRRFVRVVNDLEPDLVVLTGDLFDMDPAYIEEGCRELDGLRARYGVFAVLGNHDVYVGAEPVADGLARTRVRLLRNECARVEVGDDTLTIAGFEDPGKGWSAKHSESPELAKLAELSLGDAPTLLLVHRPSYFRQVASLGFPLALAGHTHGGQVCLPGAPESNVARLISPWTRGVVCLDDSVLYVNRGLGVAGLPLRLNCPREVALIRLRGSAFEA